MLQGFIVANLYVLAMAWQRAHMNNEWHAQSTCGYCECNAGATSVWI